MININCRHFGDFYRCNILPREKFLFFKYRPECLLVNRPNTVCNLQEKYERPKPSQGSHYNPPRNSDMCRGRCGCKCSSMPPADIRDDTTS